MPHIYQNKGNAELIQMLTKVTGQNTDLAIQLLTLERNLDQTAKLQATLKAISFEIQGALPEGSLEYVESVATIDPYKDAREVISENFSTEYATRFGENDPYLAESTSPETNLGLLYWHLAQTLPQADEAPLAGVILDHRVYAKIEGKRR